MQTQQTILVVDDTPENIELLIEILRPEYRVKAAPNGEKALSIVAAEPRPDMVLLDIMMPGMDGYEVCQRIKADAATAGIPIIFITARTDVSAERRGFALGAVDYITKPISPPIVLARVRAHLTLYRQQLELRAAYQKLELSQRRIQHDLAAAAALQRHLLPSAMPPGLPLALAWTLIPADELAGDLFNFHPLGEDRLGFYLLDVSGHGIPAAMLSVHLARLLRPGPGELAIDLGDPVAVVTQLNEGFQADEGDPTYFTIIYGVIDAHSGQGRLCQAGHPHPLVCRRDGTLETLGTGGLPVGLIPHAQYESVPFLLEAGDRLLLYSDGVTECFDRDQELFGAERLGALLVQTRDASLDEVITGIGRALTAWQSGASGTGVAFSDDLSLLAMELGAGSELSP
jgi:sigma-B regulation protein RsbU (phosphoserine phosphatase)